MKSQLKITLCLFLLLWLVDTQATEAGNGKLSKELQKAYKKECKLLKKEGWKVYDNAVTPGMEVPQELAQRCFDLLPPDFQEIIVRS